MRFAASPTLFFQCAIHRAGANVTGNYALNFEITYHMALELATMEIFAYNEYILNIVPKGGSPFGMLVSQA